jgi:dTDP-4-amino-4,6-dideoxygalactose transaminase
MSSEPFIPYHKPSIGEEEIAEVAATLRSGWLTTGPRTFQFEREFREYVQAPFALAVNSCTAGLHLALAALGMGPGDEVITTPLTFCATVNTIMQVGATPVLADIGEDGNIDPYSATRKLTAATRAIIPVHVGGLPCQMDAIWSLASKHNLAVIEDAAHAVGSHYRGVPVGACGGGATSVAAFSFYATKNLTTGEGGMVTTSDEVLAARMKRLSLHGIDADAWNRYSAEGSWHYDVTECGFKYNMSDLQAAIGLHQLRKQEGFIRRRASYAQLYASALGDIEEIELPSNPPDGRHSWHLYAIRLNLDKLSLDRAAFVKQLRERAIGSSVHFIPVPLLSYFAPYAGEARNYCPRALQLYRRLISLPLYPEMTEEEVWRVANAVKSIVADSRRMMFPCGAPSQELQL